MWEFFQNITNPHQIVAFGGLALILLILFAENGVILGFFLPGDSLLFFSGLITSTKPHLLETDIITLIIAMIVAAILGCLFGYYFGYKLGAKAFQRKESWLFKKKYVDATRNYYEKHGGKTLIVGKFLPYIRTFAPIIAGVIRVPFKSFLIYNIIGAVAWVVSLTLFGFFLGEIIPNAEEYLEIIVIGFIILTNGYVIRTYIKERRKGKTKSNSES
jgi:membrane-associated protein